MKSIRGNVIDRSIPMRHELIVDSSAQTLALKKGYKDRNSLPCQDTLIGIEVEVEQVLRSSNIGKLTHSTLWRNISDGSLRNNGREFVSAPIKGKAIPYAIDLLFNTLGREKNCIGHEFSHRTSIHIHVNYRNQTIESLANLMLIYFAVEPFLYKFVGGDRAENIYCVPITQSNLTYSVHKFYQRFEANNMNCLNIANEWMKYTGFNLQTLATYGTVEFRHLIGTDDVDKIKTWINLLLAIKVYASTVKYEDLKKTLLELNTTSEYRGFVQDVFGSLVGELSLDDMQSEMESTTIFIKDVFSMSLVRVENLVYDEQHKDKIKDFTDTQFFELSKSYWRKFTDVGDKPLKKSLEDPIEFQVPQGLFGGGRTASEPTVDEHFTMTRTQRMVVDEVARIRQLQLDEQEILDDEDF